MRFTLDQLARLALALSASGCYAAAGPMLGMDVESGRMTAGWELSAETMTYAYSTVVSEGPSRPQDWHVRHYMLWEPGFLGTLQDNEDFAFSFAGIGGSLGMHWDRLENKTKKFGFAGGMFLSAGQVIETATGGCGGDTRGYAVLVAGYRAGELYVAPKAGFFAIPGFCLY